MAFAGPPWTDRSAWRSPTRPVRRIRTRPATGSLKIAVVTLRPLHSTVFGRETFTETTRMASGLTDSASWALGTHHDFPVDELPEGRVDPRLHLGFLPVLPEPSGPEGVLRPLQPARPIVVGQDTALTHVVGVGTKEHHVEGEGHLGAEVGDRGIVVEDPDELGLLHEDLAHAVELLIEVVHDACFGVRLQRLDLKARKVHGDDDGRDDRDGLHECEEFGETEIDHAVRTTSPPHQD